ncbi:MAG: TonB family protein [Proteiniphilum sp.]|jgi:TonB family protein|nr:TonB family protein [Proteiniphilum sp.]MDD5619033.1 TonB family protein [Proteiniphilum sp.]
MHPFMIYLIEANIALSLFFILYRLLLKSDTFLQLRRFYFLSVILFSLLYPLMTVPLPHSISAFFTQESVEAVSAVYIGEPVMEIITVEESVPTREINMIRIGVVIYFSITLLFIVRFLIQLISILRVRLKSKPAEIFGTEVYRLKDDITPFSFFNLIFIHTDKHSDAELTQILLHEQTHVRQLHSVDILLIESLTLLFWWNPFVWLMKREMAMNLEYLADQGVLMCGVNSREYQYHLLRLTYQETAVPIVNNFNVSQLKQRIMMMNQSKSPAYKVGRYLLVLPLVVLFLTANSIYAAQREPADDETKMLNPAVAELRQEQLSVDNMLTPELMQAELEDQSLQQPPPEKKEEEIFVIVENQPEFPGGMGALMKLIGDSIRYPVEAQQKGIQGRVICNFVVMKDGSISDLQIVRGVDPLLDAEALRVLGLMPDWKPGKQRGQAVNVRFTLPVVFRLSGNESKVIVDDLSVKESVLSVEAQLLPNYVYPGGEDAFFRFISERIKYPVEAQEKGLQGLVNARYKIDEKGNVVDVAIEKGVGETIDREVLRVIGMMPRWVKSQNYQVSGKVIGSEAQPLHGAAVILKGTNTGVVSDVNGNFQLEVPDSENHLVISFVGYKTVEVPLSGLKSKNATLVRKLPVMFRLQGVDEEQPNKEEIPGNAVVVVGYAVK